MDTKIYRALKQLKTVGLIGEGTRVVRRKKRRGRRRVKKQLGQGVQQSGHMMGSGSVMKTTPTVQSEQALVNLQASELQLKNALKRDMPDDDRKKVLLAIEDIQQKQDMYKNAIGHILHKVKAIEYKNSGYVVDEPDEKEVDEPDEEEDEVPPVNDFSSAPLFKPQTKATNITAPVEEAPPTTFTVPSTPTVFETPKTGTPAGSFLFNPLNPYAPFGGKFAFSNIYSTATKKKAAEDEEKSKVRRDSYADISDAEQEDEPVKRTPEKETKFPAATTTPKSNIKPPVPEPRKRIKYQNLFADEEEPAKPAPPEPAKEAPTQRPEAHKKKTETWLRNFDTLVNEYKKGGGSDPAVLNATTQNVVKAAIKELEDVKEQRERYTNLGGNDPAILQSTNLREINNAVDAIVKKQTSTTRRKSKK